MNKLSSLTSITVNDSCSRPLTQLGDAQTVRSFRRHLSCENQLLFSRDKPPMARDILISYSHSHLHPQSWIVSYAVNICQKFRVLYVVKFISPKFTYSKIMIRVTNIVFFCEKLRMYAVFTFCQKLYGWGLINPETILPQLRLVSRYKSHVDHTRWFLTMRTAGTCVQAQTILN